MIIDTKNHIITSSNVNYFTLNIENCKRLIDFKVEDNMFSLLYEKDVTSNNASIYVELYKNEIYNTSVTSAYFGKYSSNRIEILSGHDNIRLQNITTTYYAFINKPVSQTRDEKISSLID